MAKAKRVALYARVSTAEQGQDPETQLHQLDEYTRARGWQVTAEFVDYAWNTAEERSQYKATTDTGKKRRIDVVLVRRYNQFAQFMPSTLPGHCWPRISKSRFRNSTAKVSLQTS